MLIIIMSGLALFSAAGSVAFAHEQRDVSKYSLEVGFFVEPAIEEQTKGIDLTVTDTATKQPVTGLEKTLQVEITCVPVKASRTFAIEPVDTDGDPGHYNSGFIPTMPGRYSFRVFGTIEGTPVNETFASGPDTFSDVSSAADLQFPQQLPSLRELDGVARAAQSTAQEAHDRASSSGTFAYIGIGLGAIGTAVGLAAMVKASKKR